MSKPNNIVSFSSRQRDDDAGDWRRKRSQWRPPERVQDWQLQIIADRIAILEALKNESEPDRGLDEEIFRTKRVFADLTGARAPEPLAELGPEPELKADLSDAEITKLLLAAPSPSLRAAGASGRWRRAQADAGRRDDADDGGDLHRTVRFEPKAKTQEPPDRGAPPIGDEQPKPNFRTLADFLAEFRPISYAVAGLMRESSLYTLTGRTGEGKTSFLVKLALAVATGRGEELIGRKVKKGRVAFATAENPDDLRMRFMVACYIFNIDAEILGRDVFVSDNRVRPEEIVDWVRKTGETLTLVIIDTWQAFFDGRDPNNNAEAVGFTRRFRPLAAAAGSPVVIIAAHPPKQAGDDNLLPYGGGATLNEIDGNFTLLRDASGLYRFSWLGKIRGLPFDPLHFRIDKLDSPDVVTIEGARVQMPVMFPLAEADVEARRGDVAKREIRLLRALAEHPSASMTELAAEAAIPRGSLSRALDRLGKERPKLIQDSLGKWTITKAGKQALEGAKNTETSVSVVSRDAERDAEP